MNKASDNDWFFLESNKTGTRWHGKCWYLHNYRKYEFDVQFEVIIIIMNEIDLFKSY